jgi:glucosyl-3-phosphoglycerate synthase
VHPDIRDWLSTRTSTAGHWDRHDLVAVKGATTVSVVLPARNEESTVGPIVRAIREQLAQAVPLVDEIVVIDSGSSDDTARVAREAGARVVRQGDVVPRLGNVPGKGEALWKSLFVTRGDVLVFVDADLKEFDPQVVVALLGPLLADAGTSLVKAVYERPLSTIDAVLPAGGGRVTELVARPLLNVHWPELAGFVQPLAGEYAARRTVLEQVPFTSGYGVEIGMLIDVHALVGLPGMAQVDLGRRVHRNQDDAALGRMAGQILLTMLDRLESGDRAVFTRAPATALKQFSKVEGAYVDVDADISVTSRPAAASVPEYADRLVPLEVAAPAA